MTWYWYVGRENELLLDLDSRKALWFFRERMRRNVNRGFLKVNDWYLYPSVTSDHYHVIVTLQEPMPEMYRAIWAAYLGSDKKRAHYTMMRILRGLDAPDLLIATRPYDVREPDHTCDCREKHKCRRITNHCPILRQLHGDEAGAEYFAIWRDRKWRTEKLRIRFGRVPLSKILNS